MGRRFGWLVAVGLALGAAGGADAATLAPVYALPLRVDSLPSVAAPPQASVQPARSKRVPDRGEAPHPATLVLLATGLGGLVALSHSEFA